MFIFEHGGKTYVVKFRREEERTFAKLYQVELDGTLIELPGEGSVIPYFRTRFEKAKGRKYALADLLYLYSTPDPNGPISPEGLTKEDREKIWIQYFDQFKVA